VQAVILRMMVMIVMIAVMMMMMMIAVMNMTLLGIVAEGGGWCKIGASKAESSRCRCNFTKLKLHHFIINTITISTKLASTPAIAA
jgi:hypothetical protein